MKFSSKICMECGGITKLSVGAAGGMDCKSQTAAGRPPVTVMRETTSEWA